MRQDDISRRSKRTASTQFAQFGALGIESAFGSAPDFVAKTAFDSQFDIFNDNFSSEAEIGAFNTSAKNARNSGFTKAAGTLLNFGAQATKVEG